MQTISNAPPALRRGFQLLMLVTLFTITCVPGRSAIDRRPVGPPKAQPAMARPVGRANSIAATGTITLYLPVVMYNSPQRTVFGVQMGLIADASGLQQLLGTQSSWVRSSNAVFWSEVQPAEGGNYNWSALSGHEQEWIQASTNKLADFVMVRSTPAWAQAQPGYACGPVKPDKLAAFGNFMHALVTRYSQAPYNLKYWEIGNEPDVDYHLVSGDSSIGCWGNTDDNYYGGGYYAEMLKVVYPQIKSADPSAQVVVGGLLLDCDPNHPPAGKDCKPARFLEGVLRQGGGPYFDVVAIHGYDAFTGALGAYAQPNWNTTSTSTSGPSMAVVAKANYVRSLMAAYGVNGKFVANNESGLGLYATTTSATFETTKAYYVAEVYGTALAEHLLANVWFSMDDDWHHQALIDPGLTARPALIAYQFASQQLGAAQFSQAITGFPGVKGYIFNRLQDSLWLLWSQDGAVHNLLMSGAPASIHHVDGTALAVTGNQLSLGPEPLYVQWNH